MKKLDEIYEREYSLRKAIAEKVGMVYLGNNSDGEPEFNGNAMQWKEYTTLKDATFSEL